MLRRVIVGALTACATVAHAQANDLEETITRVSGPALVVASSNRALNRGWDLLYFERSGKGFVAHLMSGVGYPRDTPPRVEASTPSGAQGETKPAGNINTGTPRSPQ
jgi:hypothetical protein